MNAIESETKPTAPTTARLASMEKLRDTTIPLFLDPVPCVDTLRAWFDRERIPRFKCNPLAKRGGGTIYYSVAAVEKLLRTRTSLPLKRGGQ